MLNPSLKWTRLQLKRLETLMKLFFWLEASLFALSIHGWCYKDFNWQRFRCPSFRYILDICPEWYFYDQWFCFCRHFVVFHSSIWVADFENAQARPLLVESWFTLVSSCLFCSIIWKSTNSFRDGRTFGHCSICIGHWSYSLAAF